MTYPQLIVAHIVAAVTAVVLSYSLQLLGVQHLYLNEILPYSIAGFGFYSLGLCSMAKQTINHDNKSLFSALTLFSVFLKIMLAVVIVALFKKNYDPIGMHFAYPFFISYICFWLIEIICLQRIVDRNTKTWKTK